MSKRTRKRICLIYTGGTIGMIERKGVLQPPENPKHFLEMAPEIDQIVEIDAVFPLNKDSTNIVPQDWVEIAEVIREKIDEDFDGFVVAHGTDTMHFTAAAVAFAFGPDLNVPIVFTGAQTAPLVLHGDARVNLIRACKVASEDIAEVTISFGDYVFRGCRAQKKDERKFDAFESPAFPVLAYITESIDVQPLAKRIRRGKKWKKANFNPVFAEDILQVTLVPGLKPDLLYDAAMSDRCNGVILQSFGAGNVPDSGAGLYSFEKFIADLVEVDKPVIITSQFPGGSTLESKYAPHQTAVDAGAIPTGNMTSAAASVKFRWVLSMVDAEIRAGQFSCDERLERIRSWMKRRYVGEVGPLTNEFCDGDEA